MKKVFVLSLSLLFWITGISQNTNQSRFKQLGTELPTPNVFRTGAGTPGPSYYQQQADYDIKVTLDDEKQIIYGEEIITYHNNSPDPLNYLWIQLDQNVRQKDGMSRRIQNGALSDKTTNRALEWMFPDFDGGFKIEEVTTPGGAPLDFTVNATMMRIDLERPLRKGERYSFRIKYWYNINDRMKIGGRSGYEYFPKDGNYLYTIAQFYPRMAVYADYSGWQNKQFLGKGEFTLPFGDYKVSITVPADHMVAGTGQLKNESEVLSSEQRARLRKAEKNFDAPVLIQTEEEAIEAEKTRVLDKTKTWEFEAENVRDFAFASSRKFIWDAMAVKQPSGSVVMAMSYYPKEGNPLWEKYSTRVVAHTLRTYSKYTFDYPYEKAISVHAASIGMEYPMICFNGGRPEEDGTYSAGTKHGMISVIIHEVGHNYFPMIVNSDERQWTWMDEGLNTFLQYLTEQEWDSDYPSRRGPARNIIPYMKGDKENIMPIMTNSESLKQFGNNAYGKPATALNILRETVMGRELFDHAFKHYAQTWMFKHPTPADFFRSMEDASAVDLDWFWRGWFYTTDHVDIAISNVESISTVEGAEGVGTAERPDISAIRNMEFGVQPYVVKDSVARDQYTGPQTDPSKGPRIRNIDGRFNNKYFYELTFDNIGGLVMPLIIEFTFADGTTTLERIPAEVWLRDEEKCQKVFMFEKQVTRIELDPYQETADVDRANNYWPSQPIKTRFEEFTQE